MGKPWKCYYLIPETLTGYGKRIRGYSRLSISKTKRELIEVINQFSGLYDLLPLEGHDFEEPAIWSQVFWETTNQYSWMYPQETFLSAFKDYKDALKEELPKLDLSAVIYIAGKADKTVDGFMLRNKYNRTFHSYETSKLKKFIKDQLGDESPELFFTTTAAGDGSVSWERGIPDELTKEQIYFQPTEHGELANDAKFFSALTDLLSIGSTQGLALLRTRNTGSAYRESQQRGMGRDEVVTTYKTPDILSDTNLGLLADVLGLKTTPRYVIEQAQNQEIFASVKMGHLKYASYPLMVGHFKDDGILSAESVIDVLLEGELSKRHYLGIYPGETSSNLIIDESPPRGLEAIVVGLGMPEDLTPASLTQTVAKACVNFIIQKAENKIFAEDSLGISPLLIGSVYGNITIEGSINAILEGVARANKKVLEIGAMGADGRFNNRWRLPLIDRIEFTELFRDKAYQTFIILDRIERENNSYNLKLDRRLKETQGSRNMIHTAHEKSWWMRLSIKRDQGDKDRLSGFSYSASTGRARVSMRQSVVDYNIIDALLAHNGGYKKAWDRNISKALFELLVPNDFKLSFRNQNNILLILEENVAACPWELVHYDEKNGDPLCVRTGFIRQLSTSSGRSVINPVTQHTALIIGDPNLNGYHYQLEYARKEGEQIAKLFEQKSTYQVDKLIQPNP
ncbi:MAG: hypothetical protein AAGJ93_14360, partial [Bacteroidota bacterium]